MSASVSTTCAPVALAMRLQQQQQQQQQHVALIDGPC
jgi:predicted permease